MCARVCVRVHVRLCVCACVPVSVSVRACARACVHVCWNFCLLQEVQAGEDVNLSSFLFEDVRDLDAMLATTIFNEARAGCLSLPGFPDFETLVSNLDAVQQQPADGQTYNVTWLDKHALQSSLFVDTKNHDGTHSLSGVRSCQQRLDSAAQLGAQVADKLPSS